MGPRRASELFRKKLPVNNIRVEVELYGSLAATGKGHLTDLALHDGLSPLKVKVLWIHGKELPTHPNGMIFKAIDASGRIILKWPVYSVGGGNLVDDLGEVESQPLQQYPDEAIDGVIAWCKQNDKTFWEFVLDKEGDDIYAYLSDIWHVMRDSIYRGLSKTGYLPGPLVLERKAGLMLYKAHERIGFLRDCNLVSAYALAAVEENASGNVIVTAPTCGSCGVVAGILNYLHIHYEIAEKDILKALMTAGLFGSSVVKRASISGAQVGCQGEIGTACAMAAAATSQILGGTCNQIEYAAEMALEHNLGLTCDPVGGLVQIPCIERNAFAAMRAFECAVYAASTNGIHKVSFDEVVDVMNCTGRDLQSKYRETSRGGLAQIGKETC
jgi:L-serine dehydratase